MVDQRSLLAAFARAVAAVRFACRARSIGVGDRVEFRVPVSYRARLDGRHLAHVPAGMRGVVRMIGPMPGAAGGAIVDLLDARGGVSGYWTGAALRELRRLG